MLLIIGIMLGGSIGAFIMAVFIGSREIDAYDVHIAMSEKEEEIKRLKNKVAVLEREVEIISELYNDLFRKGS